MTDFAFHAEGECLDMNAPHRRREGMRAQQ